MPSFLLKINFYLHDNIASDMYLRTISLLRIIPSVPSLIHHRSCSILNINSCLLPPPPSNTLSSERTFMFWRANINRELYGSPKKVAATRKRRRLQKSLAQIIRDGQVWRLIKETLVPEWNKWWKEVQPWDRRY